MNVQQGIPALQGIIRPADRPDTALEGNPSMGQLHPETEAAVPPAFPHRHLKRPMNLSAFVFGQQRTDETHQPLAFHRAQHQTAEPLHDQQNLRAQADGSPNLLLEPFTLQKFVCAP